MPKNDSTASGGKRLQIQIGVVKRMQKEVASYEKEVTTNEAKVQKMRDDGADSYDIKKQEDVLQESYMMVPDSKNRLEKAYDDLSACLEEVAEGAEIDPALVEEARALLEAGEAK